MSTRLQAAYAELLAAAGEPVDTHRLCEAALAYARERWSQSTGARARRPEDGSKDGRPVVRLPPFGRQKGQPINDVESKDLRWYLGVVEESLEDAAKAKWHAKNAELAQAIRAELEGRGDI